MYKKQLILIILFIGVTLSAEVKDKFKISFGTMLMTSFETEMQLTPANVPIGIGINTEDQLGMESETNVFRLDGYYRFTDTHSIDFSYFSVNSEGYRAINKAIEWNGKIIGAGAVVESYFDMDVYKVNYGYSFYHNEKVELALTAGLHITTIDLGLSASGTIDGVTNQLSDSKASGTLPLPVFGFKGEYTIIDKTLFVNYKTEYFFIGFDEYKGALLASVLNFEYHFIDNYSIGLGYNTNKIFVEMDDGDKKIEAKNTLAGVMFYLSYIY